MIKETISNDKPFSYINLTFRESDKQQMTIREIRKHYECMKLLLESNDYPEGSGFALYKEFERWQNVYQTVKEKSFKKFCYVDEDEIIDKYTINKINGDFDV